jgi:aminoglycoside phosphotransferase
MANRLHVTQKRYAAEENAVLSEVVTNLQQATEPLTSDERIVCDCDECLGNIMMDGHLLTFTNNGIDRVSEYGKALEQITASRELELFRQGI